MLSCPVFTCAWYPIQTLKPWSNAINHHPSLKLFSEPQWFTNSAHHPTDSSNSGWCWDVLQLPLWHPESMSTSPLCFTPWFLTLFFHLLIFLQPHSFLCPKHLPILFLHPMCSALHQSYPPAFIPSACFLLSLRFLLTYPLITENFPTTPYKIENLLGKNKPSITSALFLSIVYMFVHCHLPLWLRFP